MTYRSALAARLLVCGVVSVTLAACGGGSDPVTPTPVIPNVQGTWTGDYTLTACDDLSAPGFCQGFGPVGTVLPLRIVLTQSSGQLTGSVELGAFSIPVTGTVNAAGRIVLNGTVSVTLADLPTTITLGNWNTVVSGSNMTGTWRTTFAVVGFPGAPFIDSTIRNVIKTG